MESPHRRDRDLCGLPLLLESFLLWKPNSPTINPLLFNYKIGVERDSVKEKMKNFLSEETMLEPSLAPESFQRGAIDYDLPARLLPIPRSRRPA